MDEDALPRIVAFPDSDTDGEMADVEKRTKSRKRKKKKKKKSSTSSDSSSSMSSSKSDMFVPHGERGVGIQGADIGEPDIGAQGADIDEEEQEKDQRPRRHIEKS